MTRLSFLLPIAALCGSYLCVAQGTDPAVQERLNRLVQTHQGWGPELSTPGMSMTLTVAKRLSDGVSVAMRTSGLPKDKVYSLVNWPITQPEFSVVADGITLDAAGGPICTGKPGNCKGDKSDDPIDFKAFPALGEPIRMGLVSADGSVKVFAKLIPVPITADDSGCHVEATMLQPGMALVLFEASGFRPGEKLTISSVSANDSSVHEEKASARGKYLMVDMPFVDSVASGNLTFTAKASHCSLSVSVDWKRE